MFSCSDASAGDKEVARIGMAQLPFVRPVSFQFANHNPKIDPHPRCMFVLRQFMEGVSEKIARLDWLGAKASAADILKALKVQFMYEVIDGDNDLHNV